MSEAGVTLRPALDLDRKSVVGLSGKPHCDRRVRLDLNTRPGQRQNRDIEPNCVHRGQPLIAEIGQRCDEPVVGLGRYGGHGSCEIVVEARDDEMLFQGDFHDRLQIRRLLYCRRPFI
jgi:hypothetical protein